MNHHNEMQMVQTPRLSLFQMANNRAPTGNALGKEVFRKLQDEIRKYPDCLVFNISLSGIKATDASFPRDSVLALAKLEKPKRGFYLTGDCLNDVDLFDNWNAAAKITEQPLFVWLGEKPDLLGPQLSESAKRLLEEVIKAGEATASHIADRTKISVPNASTRLKRLVSDGYIVRYESSAPSGGSEYIYKRIGPEL